MLSESPLRIVHALDAYATPFTYAGAKYSYTGAIYDAYGRKVGISERGGGVRRDGRIVAKSAPRLDPQKLDWVPLNGRSLYLGHWMAHYGHWLVESTSTFWAIERLGFDQVLFHPFIFGSARYPYMDVFLAAHGLRPEQVVLLDSPRVLDYVAVAERSIVPTYCVNVTEFRRPFERLISFVGRRARAGRRLFLSRSKLKKRGREPANRKDVDKIAAQLGFEVLHPEQIPFEEQIGIYQEAEVMCGFTGSALHNVLFMGGGQVIELGDQVRSIGGSRIQQQCNHIAGADYAFVPYQSSEPGKVDLHLLKQGLKQALSRPIVRPPLRPGKVWQV